MQQQQQPGKIAVSVTWPGLATCIAVKALNNSIIMIAVDTTTTVPTTIAGLLFQSKKEVGLRLKRK